MTTIVEDMPAGNYTCTQNYKYLHSRRNATLRFATPILIVAGSLIFSALTASDLSGWRKYVGGGSTLKYLPLMAIFFAAILSALNLSPGRIVYNLIASLKVNWFLTVFLMLAFPGAIYARFVLEQKTTFFSEAVVAFAFIGAYFVFISLPDRYWSQVRLWIANTFAVLAFIAGIYVLLCISRGLSRAGKTEPAIVLLLTQGLAMAYYISTGLRKYGLFSVLTVLTLLTLKNVAVLILVVICFALYVLPSKGLRKFSVSNSVGLILVGILVLLAVGGGYLLLRSGYSDGHVDFRMLIYKTRFEEFLISPVYGRLFTAGTSFSFGRSVVPSHSDWVDVLAQGGLIGLTLFVGIFMRTGFLLLKARRQMIESDSVNFKLISWQLTFLISVILSFSFNSILGTPSIALIVWVGMAFAHRLARPL